MRTIPHRQKIQQDKTYKWATNWQQAQQQRHRIPKAHRIPDQNANQDRPRLPEKLNHSRIQKRGAGD
jgi:hypothetical protein